MDQPSSKQEALRQCHPASEANGRYRRWSVVGAPSIDGAVDDKMAHVSFWYADDRRRLAAACARRPF